MATWEELVFTRDNNEDFLEELTQLDDEEVVEAVRDAVVLAMRQDASEEEKDNGLAAATIAAIWSGAPYSAGDIVAEFPFIKTLVGSSDEELNESAAELLEGVEDDCDLEPFLSALA